MKNLIVGACALCGFALSATAEMVEYWDPVGKVTNSVEAVVVTKDTATLESGWYVVTGEVSRAQIEVQGTDASPANLILADGAKLTARDSSDYHPGIKVASGAALNIYAQSVDADTMGQISASGGHGGAGIGGAGEGGTCGTVNIYGGKLTAVGGDYAAGIGGGGKASKTGGTGGAISIYGGIVTANGENGGAAIGGGNRADGGTISIYGGEVIADNTKGDSEGAGIGGGYAGAGGMILIAGGKVTAVGGYKDDGGAGIGGGEEGSGGTIMITGGIVNATGTDYGAGIGGGDEGAGGDVTISGGTVVAKAGMSSVWDIGSGNTGGGDTGEFVVTGGSVLLANSMKCRDGYPTNGDGTQVYCTMVPGFEANAAVKIEGLPNYGTNDIFADASGNVYLYLPKGNYSFTANGEARSVTVVNATKVFATYWDPISGTEKSALCVAVGDSTVLEDGNWYVVNGRVERSFTSDNNSVVVNGKANLILADGCEFLVFSSLDKAGVAVDAWDSLSIYGQKEGTGKLSVKGGEYGAGIGGGSYVVGIYGKAGDGGTVTINGGTVIATGGWCGAGIGGGAEGAGGTVKITNGRLNVKAGEYASVIGAGRDSGSHGRVEISGGAFAWRPYDAWLVDREVMSFVANPDDTSAKDYPWAVMTRARVTFGRSLEHMTAAWTSGDGTVTNAISGTTSFVVPKGESGAKIIFTPKGCYEIDKTEYAFAGPINEDCTIPAEDLPTAQLVWPEGYRQIEYIESTVGGGQYIDTGVKASSTLAATMDYRAFEHTGRFNLGTFGDDNADWRYLDYSGGPLFDCGSARAGSTPGNTLDLNVRYVVNVGLEGDNICLAVTNAETKAEVKSFKAARSGAPSAENVFVFGGNSGGCTSMRLYSLTLRDFAVSSDKVRMTVAEFVPCVRASDGAVGLFDIENGVFKENEGSGSFVAKSDLLVTVTVPSHAHVIASWTSGDGTVTNAIGGTTFEVLKGTTGVKVIFTPEERYGLDKTEYVFAGAINEDCTIPAEDLPTASYLYAVVTVGQLNHMTAAWTSGDGTVTNAISGTTFEVLKGTTGVKVLFTPEERYWLDKTEYVFDEAINGDCTIPAEDLPTASYFYAVVTVGQLNHMTAAWTSGDGTVTNAINGTFFEVLKGTTGVKVIFTPEHNYQFVDVNETGVRELDSPLTKDCDVTPPQVEGVLGTVANPWNVGDAVTAYVSDDGTLVIGGTGAMGDFASAADAPWNEIASEVSAVTVADGVTHVGKNAFMGIADAVTVNGTPISFYDMMAGARGLSASTGPSGAISGAEFEAVQIVDGKAYLDVSVFTSDTVTNQNWSVATNGVIEVPAPGKQGFFILQSKSQKQQGKTK